MLFRCLRRLRLAQHQLFQRGESSFQFTVGLTKLLDFLAQLFDLDRLLLELIRSLVQLFNRQNQR